MDLYFFFIVATGLFNFVDLCIYECAIPPSLKEAFFSIKKTQFKEIAIAMLTLKKTIAS